MEATNNELNLKDLKELKEKLTALKDLLDEGLLTQEEYEDKRNQIIGKKQSPVVAASSGAVSNKAKVRKCPNCGESLNSFDPKCPTCGYEIQDASNTDAMNRFQDELFKFDEQLKNGAGIKLFGFDVLSGAGDRSALERKCEYIKNYIVPKTKEDFIEFGILAKSNVEVQLYKKKSVFDPFCGCKDIEDFNYRKKLSDAWWSMLQQIFDKSKVVFSDDEKTYKKIESLYVEIYNKIM